MFKKMKELARRTVQSGRNVAAAGGSMLLLGASQAHAALPPEATAAFGKLSDNVTDVTAAVWPILGATVAAFGLMKLFKKGASKAV